jgi:hypothetical protein
MNGWTRLDLGKLCWMALLGWMALAGACAEGSTPDAGAGGSAAAGPGTSATSGGSSGKGGDGAGGDCTEPADTPGDCKKTLCQGGVLVAVNDDGDAPNDGKACTLEACSAGSAVVTPVNAGALCAESGGKFCDGSGSCVACLSTSDCDAGETCSPAHACVPDSCADGSQNGDETDIDCGGSCGATCPPGKACSSDGDCAMSVCVANVCTSLCDDGIEDGDETDIDCGGACALLPDPKKCGPDEGCAVDADCAGGDCASMKCVPNCKDSAQNNGETGIDCGGPCPACVVGNACASPADCQGGPCVDGVCCSEPCDGLCKACSAAKKGVGPDGICGNMAMGSDPDNECAGALLCAVGQCQVANGQSCALAVECQSGFCADGVCCNAACAGLCQACSAVKKGAGADGSCGSIASGGDPDDECAGATACNGGGACALVVNGNPCAVAAECQSGFCVDGVCCSSACNAECQACTAAKKGNGSNGSCGPIATATDPDNECPNALVCAPGGCKLPNGEACVAPATCVSGFCVDGVCCDAVCSGPCLACVAAKKGAGVDGTCGNITSGTDPDAECGGAAACSGAGACALFANGVACAVGLECASGFCVDGVCCNGVCSSTCQACSLAKKGAGANGVCGPVVAGNDPDDECAGAAACNGANACALLTNGTPCALGAECQSGQCADGVCCNAACGGTCQACTLAKKGAGADGTCGPIVAGTDPDSECGGAASCNGANSCALFASGVACAINAECQSGFCVDGVCCNAACNTTCQACTAAKKGAGADGACASIASGMDPDNECAGAQVCNGAGACKLPNGQACAAGAECISTFCADGVCCNAACGGVCQACSAAKKGGGQDGTCGSIPAGADPDSECGGAASCNGVNACALFASGVACAINAECASGFCVDGVCCSAACNAPCQACSAVKKGAGADGSCGSIVSGSDPDNECAGAQVCNGLGACKLPNGQPCALGADCVSTFCVDGVCCNAACGGSCQACSLAKKGAGADGTCGNIAVGSDPDGECFGAIACNGVGACALFANGVACTDNLECSSGFCVDGYCCNSVCNVLCQACSAVKKNSGANGTCGSIAANTDPDSECPGVTLCSGAATCALLANGAVCTLGSECSSGSCVDGVCCNSPCNGTCLACTTAKKGAGANGTCGVIAANTDPDAECPGATTCTGAGVCGTFVDGAACTQNAECASNVCADGVCCNALCDGLCRACVGSKTTVSDGTCADIVTGTDPDNECDDLTAAPNCGGSSMCGP